MTLTLNAAKDCEIPKPSMRHVAVVNAIDVKQKNRQFQIVHPQPARRLWEVYQDAFSRHVGLCVLVGPFVSIPAVLF